MVDLDAIEQRVRATIRETKGKDVIERIISEDDFEALMRAARGRAAQHAVPAVVLLQFRDFVIREATQWTLNGSHHNPIWQRVAEALDAVGLNDVRICRVCDALDRELAWTFSNLCTACAQKAGGDAVLDQSGATPEEHKTTAVIYRADGGYGCVYNSPSCPICPMKFPCAYPDCECDDGTGPCCHMRDAGHTTFPKM